MKKTVSVSIDEDVLARAKELAWTARKTFSEYVEMKISSGWEAPKFEHKDLVTEIPVEKKKPASEAVWNGGYSKEKQLGKRGAK